MPPSSPELVPSRTRRQPITAAARTRRRNDSSHDPNKPGWFFSAGAALLGVILVWSVLQIYSRYAVSFQWPVRLHWQSPIVIAERIRTTDAQEARFDQGGHSLSPYQQYACQKFGPDCRVALAIQRAENPSGKCEIYHYNADGTLDWGYFQINTVHLQRPGLNLRDLLDCRANIDFAFQLYSEHRGFGPWSTFNNGAYLRFLRR